MSVEIPETEEQFDDEVNIRDLEIVDGYAVLKTPTGYILTDLETGEKDEVIISTN